MAGSDYGMPEASGLSKEAVYELAQNIGVRLKYEPGAALEPIVEKIGGTIEYQSVWDLETTASGSIKIDGEGDFSIFLADHTGPLRDRFTIAHELGHYVLHFMLPLSQGKSRGPLQATRSGSGRVEWEANWFAAGFLMPQKAFKTAFAKDGGDLFKVAEKFGVSEQAAEIRARALGLS